MAELKTKPSGMDVEEFLAAVPEKTRDDCRALVALMRRATGEEPRMWGPAIVGFGSYHYRYESGREGDWFLAGFSPRKRELSLYVMAGFDRFEELMGRLGRYKTGKSCLYLRSLADVDLEVLEELVRESSAHVLRRYGAD